MLPALESTGLKVGEDFFLAFSPERVDPGNPKWNTRNTPKVVGGITETCRRVAVAIYGPAIQRPAPGSSTPARPTGKSLVNTLRSACTPLAYEVAGGGEKLPGNGWEGLASQATEPV